MLQRILRFKLFAAFLTFTVGAAVALLFIAANRSYDGETIPTFVEQEEHLYTSFPALEPEPEYQLPPVTAIYISTCNANYEDPTDNSIKAMDIAIFYADGRWGSISDELWVTDGKYSLSIPDGYGASIGIWQPTKTGVLIEEIESHGYANDAWITENEINKDPQDWQLVKGHFGKDGSQLKVNNLVYRFVRAEKIEDIDVVLTQPFWVKDSHRFAPNELSEDRF